MLAGVIGAAAAALRASLPRSQGELRMPGLLEPARIVRDARGLATAEVGNWTDGWRCLGYLHGQERAFQMDIQRRMAAGRLSELLGKRTESLDVWYRKLGFAMAAEREWDACEPDEREVLLAYAQGVNFAWSSAPRAPEFALLGVRPEPWRPIDTWLWMKGLAHELASAWDLELLRTALFQECPQPEALARWLQLPAGLPLTPNAATPDLLRALLDEWEEVSRFLPPQVGGSNAWAVAGWRSEDGLPMLANDPHLGAGIPDHWFQCALRVEGRTVQGATMPGLAGILVGQNGDLAWGVTNAYVDVQDVFLERFQDTTRNTVHGPDGPQAVTRRRETVFVRGSSPRALSLEFTPRGPLLQSQGEHALSLSWSGRDPGRFFRSVTRLNACSDVDQAREALRDWHVPCLNFILADRRSIAHQLVGRIPRRRRGSGLTVMPAWEKAWAWQGFLEPDELPGQTDPECGYLVSANHSLQAEDGPFLGWDFNPGFRALRIETRLLSKERHDLASFQSMQCDPGSALAELMLQVTADVEGANPIERQVLQLWREGEGAARANHPAATIGQTWLHVLVEEAAREQFGDHLAAALLGKRITNSLGRQPTVMARLQANLLVACRDGAPGFLPEKLGWAELWGRALTLTVQRLSAALGPDPGTWLWKRVHVLRLNHHLGWTAARLEVDGDSDSPNQTAVDFRDGIPASISLAPTLRFVTRLAQPTEFACAHLPGESGHPLSPHFRDGIPDWKAGRYYQPQQAQVQRELRLIPDGTS